MNDKLPQLPEVTTGPPRRRFMNTAALAGWASGTAACNQKTEGAATAPASALPAVRAEAAVPAGVHPRPGELDTYYGLWSGGHTGDVRVLGMPSGRELLHPGVQPDALVGWGITNESKAVMGTKADGSLRYTVADTHHVHASCGTATTTAATPGSTTRSTAAWRASASTTSSATRSPSCPTCRASTASSRQA